MTDWSVTSVTDICPHLREVQDCDYCMREKLQADIELRVGAYKLVLERIAEAEQLLHDLYWHDWSHEREAEVRKFLGVLDDGPRPLVRVERLAEAERERDWYKGLHESHCAMTCNDIPPWKEQWTTHRRSYDCFLRIGTVWLGHGRRVCARSGLQPEARYGSARAGMAP